MRVTLIGKKYIIKDTLNNNIDDFWLVDNTKESNDKLIKISNDNGIYKILSSEYSKILDKRYLSMINNDLTISQPIEYVMKEVVLEENHMYPIIMSGTNEINILCCMPDYEDYFTHLDIINTREITIGSSNNNSIVYKNPLIEKLHARIYKNGDKWTLENYDSKYGVFVNHYPVYKNVKNIFNGDIIFIMGLEIVIIKDTIYINNPDNRVSLDRKYFKSSEIEEELMNKKIRIQKKEYR